MKLRHYGNGYNGAAPSGITKCPNVQLLGGLSTAGLSHIEATSGERQAATLCLSWGEEKKYLMGPPMGKTTLHFFAIFLAIFPDLADCAL